MIGDDSPGPTAIFKRAILSGPKRYIGWKAGYLRREIEALPLAHLKHAPKKTDAQL